MDGSSRCVLLLSSGNTLYLVEHALRTALGTGAVVTHNIDHQCVVELPQVPNRLEEPADIGVGLLQVPSVQLRSTRNRDQWATNRRALPDSIANPAHYGSCRTMRYSSPS